MNNKILTFKSLIKVLVTSFVLLSTNSFAATPGTTMAELKAEIMSNSSKFGVQATMLAVEGKGAVLAANILKAANIAKAMEGCELYVVFLSKDTPELLLITEVWTTKTAHTASLQNPEIREIIDAAKPIIAGIDHKWGLPLGGKGL